MTDSDIFREVDEELRRERLEQLWKRYNGLILGVAFAIIVGVAGYKGWQYKRHQDAITAGANYQQALDDLRTDKKEDAARLLAQIAANGPAGYRALAQFQQAYALSQDGKTEEAQKAYQALLDGGTLDPVLKGYAQLQAANLRVDKADFTEMKNRLNDLAADGSPWRHGARELLGLSAYKAGDMALAGVEFNKILLDAEAPPGIKARAEMMLGVILAKDSSPAAAPAVAPATGEAAAPTAPATPAAPAAPAATGGQTN